MRKILFFSMLCAALVSGPAQAPADPLKPEDLAPYKGTVILARAIALNGHSLLITERTRADRLPDIITPGETRLRLWGIDAPALHQPGGWQALGALDQLLEQSENIVQCSLLDIPASTRHTIVARCTDARQFQPFAEKLVGDGWALAFRHFTWRNPADEATALSLDKLQATARREKRGIWGLATFR